MRPENLKLGAGQPFAGEVQLVEPLGNQHVVWLHCAGATVSAVLPGQPEVEDGAKVCFGFDATKTLVRRRWRATGGLRPQNTLDLDFAFSAASRSSRPLAWPSTTANRSAFR